MIFSLEAIILWKPRDAILDAISWELWAVVENMIDKLCLARNIEVHVPKYFYKIILGMEPGKKPLAIG